MIASRPYRQPQVRRAAPRTTRVPVTVYGRPWCGISQMTRRFLDRSGIPYDYVDLDAHPDVESQLSWVTGGRVRSPTVDVGGELLLQPSNQELARVLARRGAR